MARGIRVKEGEDFSKSTIKRVINLLESDKPITKKAACDMLNMAYNTTRLNKIIEDYKAREEHIKKRKASLRGTPLSDREKANIISSYLEGTPISEIEDSSFRSKVKISAVLREYNIPERVTTKNYESVFLPDGSICEEYKEGDLVFSAKYNCIARVKTKYKEAYRIWLYGDYNQWAYQPFWELGSLVKVQEELDINITDFSGTEIQLLINEALVKAKKFKNAEK